MKKFLLFPLIFAMGIALFSISSCLKEDESDLGCGEEFDTEIKVTLTVRLVTFYPNGSPYSGPIHFNIKKKYCDGTISGNYSEDITSDWTGHAFVQRIYQYVFKNSGDRILISYLLPTPGDYTEMKDLSLCIDEHKQLCSTTPAIAIESNSFNSYELIITRLIPINPKVPSEPVNPFPADSSDCASLLPVLQWECDAEPGDSMVYDVWIRTWNYSNNHLVAEGISENYFNYEESFFELNENSIYEWWVVAKNNYNIIARSKTWIFETEPGGETFTDDRDGRCYMITHAAGMTWFAENLRYKSPQSWWYNNYYTIESNLKGRLYTWDAAKFACPSGWHLPSDEEWSRLEKSLGMPAYEADSGTNWRGTLEGNKLKSTDWYGSDEIGFNALPAGIGHFNDNGGITFYYDISEVNWWTSTISEDPFPGAWVRELEVGEDGIYRGTKDDGKYALSVRCVKD